MNLTQIVGELNGAGDSSYSQVLVYFWDAIWVLKAMERGLLSMLTRKSLAS